MDQKREPVRPYQELRYWSNVPFRHGAEDIVKYSASPAATNAARAFDLTRPDPNALGDELIRHLNEDATMSSFDFGLQLLDADNMHTEVASRIARRDGVQRVDEDSGMQWRM